MHETVQFLLRHGYIVVFVAVLAEQIGLPLPAAPVLLAAGALAASGTMSLGWALVFAVVASLIGDAFWFALGRLRGRSVLTLLCRLSLEPDSCVRRTEHTFSVHHTRALLFAKFVPGVSTVTPPLAALMRMSLPRFLIYDGAGAALWAGAYLALGLVFGVQLERLALYAFRTSASLVALVAAGIALYVGIKYRQRRKFYSELRMARISPQELNSMLEAGEPVVVVDLRHPSFWEDGHIPGALLMRNTDLDRLPPIAGDRELILYCS